MVKNIKRIIMKKIALLFILTTITFLSCAKENGDKIIEKKEIVPCVFIGNSITEFWANLRPDFFRDHSFVGKGIGGQTSSQILKRFYDDVVYLHPQTVVIEAGTNDIAQNQGYISNEDIMKNVGSMCEIANRNNIKIILCSVLPSYQFGWRPEIKPAPIIKDLNSMIKAYADQHLYIYANYYDSLVDERGGLPAKYSEDGVHPNIECYKIMERIILESIGKVVQLN